MILKVCELPWATVIAPRGLMLPFDPAEEVIVKVVADGVKGEPVGTTPLE